MKDSDLIKIDVWLGAIGGALEGATSVLRDYQGVVHQRSLGMFVAQLDLRNEGDLMAVSEAYGLDGVSAIERYRSYRERGCDPFEARSGTDQDISASLGHWT